MSQPRFKSLGELECRGKRVIVRVDFNTPLKDGRVSDDTRIKAALPSLKLLLEKGGRLIVMSHLGRPEGCGFEEAYSMRPVAQRLVELLGEYKVHFVADIAGEQAQDMARALQDGELMLVENLRFDRSEKKNDPSFAAALASLGEYYVNDAFGVSHRAHASVAAITEYLPAYAGLLMEKELKNLSVFIDCPPRPFVACLGGSKVSDKLALITQLMNKCDTLLIGGGMSFTFLKALGYEVGTSLLEEELVDTCKDIFTRAKNAGVDLLVPSDLVVADSFSETARTQLVRAEEIPTAMMGLDIGTQTIQAYQKKITAARSVFWNGPMGVFEMKPFEAGTRAIAQAMADNEDALTVIGGGDSVAAAHQFGLAEKMSFISTGGGASMKLIEGGVLPALEALAAHV